ncbi:MAG: PspC domain-containing protein [Planctomycetota bacterium]
MSVPSPQNPLTRSTREQMIGGVCAGIARWLGWDPTLVRVLYVVVSLFSVAFPGIIVYLVLWVVMPQDDHGLR